jgi:Mrp family chromosome partitioning ATPase
VVAGPLVLSNMVDGVLIVVEANRTDRNMVIQSFTRLREMKANIIGAIMNKLSARTATYGYYNYYSYGYYYADGEGEGEAQGAPREPAAR